MKAKNGLEMWSWEQKQTQERTPAWSDLELMISRKIQWFSFNNLKSKSVIGEACDLCEEKTESP